jgi:hypothetical protein
VVFEAVVGGTSGGSAPVWGNAVPGALVTGDNGVTWRYIGDQFINLYWYPVATGNTLRIGSCRVFSGKVQIHTPNTVVVGSAAPTGGTWMTGDQVLNSAPSAAGYIGWVCVSGGAPGAWEGFGSIA